ncbi:MAG TPA: TIGR03016 family PEP-CTERM system-associated outer membrane protein [Acetobacteraceae bacterium]|nr:TIGR03016 family PEP-CTERM system-associated outer membrane protein [Acetobacteraceae bacterium]
MRRWPLVAALGVAAALPVRHAYALPASALDSPGSLAPGGLPSSLAPPTTSEVPAPGAAGTEAAPGAGTEAAPGATTETGPGGQLVVPRGVRPTSILPAPGAGWRVQPSIGVQEYFTDNAFQTPTNKSSDFITGITPGLTLSDDGPRVQASVNYQPTALIYARNSSQTRFDQNFSGQATVTLVPDEVFLDARGYVTQGASNGGFAPGNQVLLSRNQSTTVTTFTVSPYAVHRFGDIGTAEIGATLGTTSTSGGQTTGFDAFGTPVSGNPNGDSQSVEELAQFTTGAILPRIQNRTQFDATQQTGNVGTQQSTRFYATNRVEYALNHHFALIGEIGYENLRFSGFPPTRISDAIWRAGGRWDPDPDSSITITYGHRDGFNSLFVNAYYALTARTTLFASYTSGLQTDQDLIQNNLSLAALDENGQIVNSQNTGPLFISNNLTGFSDNLFRSETLNASVTTSFDRDSVSFGVFRQQQTPIAVASAGQAAQKQVGTSGDITWTHAISDVTNASLRGDYGTTNASGSFLTGASLATTNQEFIDLTATLTRQFTPSLSGLAEYMYTHRSSDQPGLGFVQNLFLVGVQKTF